MTPWDGVVPLELAGADRAAVWDVSPTSPGPVASSASKVLAGVGAGGGAGAEGAAEATVVVVVA